MRFDPDRGRKIPGSVWAFPRQWLAILSLPARPGLSCFCWTGRELSHFGQAVSGESRLRVPSQNGERNNEGGRSFSGKSTGWQEASGSSIQVLADSCPYD